MMLAGSLAAAIAEARVWPADADAHLMALTEISGFWPTFRDGNESFWALCGLCGGAEITRICVISGGCVG